ncbi:helix-turn-helix domain-containing protein [Clostridium sardiniense]|uniref:helix-turn-helix domain-containing protein n=1 Tax=Clostridium sardiniense TaxID=29369 RepID=UPI00195A2EFD|nr:XRE family transcriptional regulator [Clostridium sardiniense]MBM7835626.1 repressor LexA [Clostridium sardiniense]
MHYLNDFGEKLKFLRKSNNLTQQELANKLNVTKQTISFYELGKREPSLGFIIDISKYFNCSIDELLSIKYPENLSKLNTINDLLEFNINIFSINELSLKLKNKKLQLEKFQIEIPKKVNEINSLIKFLDTISKENSDLKNTKTDTEFSSELLIDLKNLSDEKTSKEKNIDDYTKKKKSVKIPVYDLPISAGSPKYSEEPVIDELRTLELKKPLTENNLEDFYILKVSGDSMNNIVDNGEEVLIQGTHCVKNGEIAVVTLLKDSHSTIKYYYRHGNEIILKPNSSNPQNHTQRYNLNEEEILVQGRYIGKVKNYLIQSKRD